mmetsp:Transcript_3141/g.5841  ORF Transcript_3141/g.5841 Transcript_3141/m.5841 type:complete len:1874 (+) Transcript_3141:94-5715(+)|eukprot:CAMPEP_0176481320 /NCGR_PEP_ID=MMETSP0200_2-20121128/2755_1 /TAXON_ID=947934 /ORGANISM="Chaetoceros sp., Strain GSL56" /LENGTH=1873 /DNA_ID=CAMNT_0017877513 /DNA_START=8 /DNA_END=5629 /DNA_ORIENTATION=+
MTSTSDIAFESVSDGRPDTSEDPYLSNDFYPLKQAHDAVIAALRADEAAPDSDLYRRITSVAATSSDSRSRLYQAIGDDASFATSNINDGDFYHNTLSLKNSIPLPPYLRNIIKETKHSSLMGILPQGNMAWVSVDDSLYLWEYGSLTNNSGCDKEDFVCFRTPSGQFVVSVGLVKPKPGVFKDIVEWCIVVTTPEEAIICALAREINQTSDGLLSKSSKSKDSHLVLIPTRYEIPTDSVPMMSVCGTEDGRIFMGGFDGCLYEMSYEANIPMNNTFGNAVFYDDENVANEYEYISDSGSFVKTIATSGKRALSSLVFGPVSSVETRPRKCRKVNHSSFTSSLVSAFLPGFVLKAASVVFGTSPVSKGGPIVNLTLDSDRKTLYALTSGGFIHAFDLDTEIAKSQMEYGNCCSPPKLACSVNVTKSVRRYLDTISHGRTYPPSSMGSDYSIASVTFPGGGSGAQYGVGGMEGARAILKIADAKVLRKISPSASRKSTNGLRSSFYKSKSGTEGCLHPISIHVVPASESRYITLVAISSGGLRYYFSVLPDAGTSYNNTSSRPGNRFALCHVRAPPPLSINSKNEGVSDANFDKAVRTVSSAYGKESKGSIFKGCYISGITVLAIDRDDRNGDVEVGDSILAVSPDYTVSEVEASKSKVGQNLNTFPNGVNEILSLPTYTSLLPGGHVWELNSRPLSIQTCNSVLRLYFRSITPPSSSQHDKLPPIFLPPSHHRYLSSKHTEGTSIKTIKYHVPKTNGIADLLKAIWTGKSKIVTIPPGVSQRRMNAYQMLDRYGCDNSGFSLPPKAKGSMGRKTHFAESPRLPLSITNPFPVPLSEMSLQHLILDTNLKDVLALNSGGIYHFVESSPINKLYSLFSNSTASSIGSDERVKIFFKKYGHKESCAMCLSIAINPKTDNSIVRKVVQAALSYAHRPHFVRSSQASGDMPMASHGTDNIQPFSQTMLGSGIEGFSFIPSHLHDGLLSLTSRLLRPIWCKPAVLVTEGRIVRHKSSGISEQAPAKVELLLNQKTLDDLRRPLAALAKLMREVFEPAIKCIPGLPASDSLMLEAADRKLPQGTWITQALQYQNQVRHQNDSIPPQPNERQLTAVARLREERSIHALYRLVSRTVQLLSFLDLIYRAQLSPHLPEVEFGYIHGLTFSQLVTAKGAQDRIEAMLTKLLSSPSSVIGNQDGGKTFTVESDNLCSLLSEECYLFFSLGSRLAFLGFRSAEAASSSSSVSKQAEYIMATSNYFREASKYWYSSSYVIGQGSSLDKKGLFSDSENAYDTYNSLAINAIENDTPLARATFVLIEINDASGLVDICFNCAKNFENKKSYASFGYASNDELNPINILPWEKNLYHAQFHEHDDANSLGYKRDGETKFADLNDNNKIVKHTCYALLYYHLGKLLESCTQHPHDSALADQLISVSMSSTDLLFLHGLYSYLLTSGNVDTLLRLDSTSLEKWLSKDDDSYNLLWRYYTFHNIHWMAGEVMWNRATAKSEKTPLEERVECLTKSLGSYSTALRELSSEKTMLQKAITAVNMSAEQSLTFKYGSSPSGDELNRVISEIGELIDVAKIQTRVLSVIMTSANSGNIDEAQMSELKTSLLDISKIYNEFAAPLSLYDLCLAILRTCNHDDPATISKLWRSIICEELLPCRTTNRSVQKFLSGLQKDSMLEHESIIFSLTPVMKENGETLMTFEDGGWIVNIKSRIVGLGRELLGKNMDTIFPTYFIAECLEGLRQVYTESTGIKTNLWPVESLIESGVSFPLTLDAYHNMYVRQGGNSDVNLILEVLCAIAEILNLWLVASVSQKELTTSMRESASVSLARYAGNILKEIDNYKCELESFVTANPDEISRCYALFDDIEGSLRRKK